MGQSAHAIPQVEDVMFVVHCRKTVLTSYLFTTSLVEQSGQNLAFVVRDKLRSSGAADVFFLIPLTFFCDLFAARQTVHFYPETYKVERCSHSYLIKYR